MWVMFHLYMFICSSGSEWVWKKRLNNWFFKWLFKLLKLQIFFLASNKYRDMQTNNPNQSWKRHSDKCSFRITIFTFVLPILLFHYSLRLCSNFFVLLPKYIYKMLPPKTKFFRFWRFCGRRQSFTITNILNNVNNLKSIMK